jgi:RPA family protein
MVQRTFTKRKITKRLKKKKQSGGGDTDYWRMTIPDGTGPGAGFSTLVNDIYAIVGSSVNTILDTVAFVKNVTTFKSDMGSEMNPGDPGNL